VIGGVIWPSFLDRDRIPGAYYEFRERWPLADVDRYAAAKPPRIRCGGCSALDAAAASKILAVKAIKAAPKPLRTARHRQTALLRHAPLTRPGCSHRLARAAVTR
jgi:hypothetical protein